MWCLAVTISGAWIGSIMNDICICYNSHLNKPVKSLIDIVTFCICRVIDLGVMTPCEKIIDTALKEKAGTCDN